MRSMLATLAIGFVACAASTGCDPCGRIIFLHDLSGPFDGCTVDADCIEGEVCDDVCGTCNEPADQ